MVAKTILITTYSQKSQLEQEKEHWKDRINEAVKFENREINNFKRWEKMIEKSISKAKALYEKIRVYWSSFKDSFDKEQNYKNKELIDSLNHLKKYLKSYSEKQCNQDHIRILEWFDYISKFNNDRFQKYKDQTLTILVNKLSSFAKGFEQLKNSYIHKIAKY